MFTPFKPTQLIACILLSILFLWSGIVEKMFAWSATLAFMQPRHLPLAGALLAGALLIEVMGPVLLFFRRTSAPAALVLAGYCLLTALLFHDFWSGDDAAHSQLTAFLKDVGLSGAFLYVFSDLLHRARRVTRTSTIGSRWPDAVLSTMDR